jgi:hypothetical protein
MTDAILLNGDARPLAGFRRASLREINGLAPTEPLGRA